MEEKLIAKKKKTTHENVLTDSIPESVTRIHSMQVLGGSRG